MITITVSSHSFNLSTPYTEGHPLTAEEAKALNNLRADRLRNIISKRMAKWPSAPAAEDLADIRQEVAKLDHEFEFRTNETRQARRFTLQDELSALCIERVREIASQIGEVLTDELAAARADLIRDDARIVAEAQRRYEARIAVAQQGLADLLA